MVNPLKKALSDVAAEDFINSASDKYLLRVISGDMNEELEQGRPERLPRFGYIFEREGLQAYIQWIRHGSIRITQITNGSDVPEDQLVYGDNIVPIFSRAFNCWRSI